MEMRRKRKKKKARSTLLQNVKRRAESKHRESETQSCTPPIPKVEMENDLLFDPFRGYKEGSRIYEKLQAEARRVVEVLDVSPIPEGLRPAIASGPSRQERSWLCVMTLLANIHTMIAKGKDTLAVSMNPATYSGTPIGAGIINLIKLARHCRLLMVAPGYHNPKVPKDFRLTRIQPTEKLNSLLTHRIRIDEALDRKRQHLVELRRTVVIKRPNHRTNKIKKTIPREVWLRKANPKKVEEALDRENLLRYYNRVFRDYTIACRKKGQRRRSHLNCDLHCVYEGRFTKDGRFYTSGDGYQCLSKEERETITINGIPTNEYDYSGLHIRMLYALAGKTCPLDKDPYASVLGAINTHTRTLSVYP